MNQSFLQEIGLLRELLQNQQEIGIVLGSHQTLDNVAAALALYLSFSQSGIKTQIVSKKEPTVEVSGLVGVDKITSSFSGNTTKLVVSLPYIKGEVEKVLFTEQPNTINFHLTAAEGRNITPFDTRDIKLNWEGGAPTCIVTVGIANVDELNGLVDPESVKIVNIDIFAQNSRYGDVVLVDETFSSISEIVGKTIKEMQMPFDMDIAQNLLDGILFATRNFTKSNTSPIAFEIASQAMYSGAKRHDMARQDQGQARPQGRDQRNPASDHPAFFMQNKGQQQGREQGQRRDERRNQHQNQQRNAAQQNQQVTNVRQQIRQQDNEFAAEDFDNQPQQPQPQVPQSRQNKQPQQEEIVPQPQDIQPQNDDEIPEDWLMPKVFKSSKSGN